MPGEPQLWLSGAAVELLKINGPSRNRQKIIMMLSGQNRLRWVIWPLFDTLVGERV